MAKILSIIAANGYQDQEYEDSKKAMEKKGHEVITCSTVEEAEGKFGGKTKVDVLLGQVNSEDYDAIAYIGGPGSSQYFNHPVAQKLAHEFYNSNKIVAAICAAPTILANAGLLRDKKATCFDSQQETLHKKGAILTGKSVEKDGLIITADGPKAAKKFGKVIAKALKKV